MKKQWEIIYECDDEDGDPCCWCLEINQEKYGKYCWITFNGKYFGIEVDYGTKECIEIMQCKTLTSAKRWVSMNLL